MKKNRLGASLLCAAMVFVLILSTVYILEAAGHSCTGQVCEICANVFQAEALARRLSLAGVMIGTALIMLRLTQTVPAAFEGYSAAALTPVRWKVRLND